MPSYGRLTLSERAGPQFGPLKKTHHGNSLAVQYASNFGKLSSGHRTEKGQFSFQSQRKAMPKNAQTTAHREEVQATYLHLGFMNK